MSTIKTSGKSTTYEGGMVRDTEDGKPRYDLLVPLDLPMEEQFLYRIAVHLAEGASKPGRVPRNWELASDEDAMARFKSSAFRHFMAWFYGETDEDHMAACAFNLMGYETTAYKLRQVEGPCSTCVTLDDCVDLC